MVVFGQLFLGFSWVEQFILLYQLLLLNRWDKFIYLLIGSFSIGIYTVTHNNAYRPAIGGLLLFCVLLSFVVLLPAYKFRKERCKDDKLSRYILILIAVLLGNLSADFIG